MKRYNQSVNQLEHKMITLVAEYCIYKTILETFPGVTEEEINALKTPSAFVAKIDASYAFMNEEEKNILNNEYFYQGYPFWWIGLFSKSSFYRKKKMALNHFIEVFENE